MLRGSGNHMVKPIKYRQVTCAQCGGTGTMPANPDNMDDDREIECSMCGGLGNFEKEY